MKIYNLVQEAEQDLNEILFYIAQDNQAAADQLIDKLYEAMDKIAEYPEIGSVRPDWVNPKVRFWPVGRYLIIYEIAKPLQILRILSAYRDLTAILNL